MCRLFWNRIHWEDICAATLSTIADLPSAIGTMDEEAALETAHEAPPGPTIVIVNEDTAVLEEGEPYALTRPRTLEEEIESALTSVEEIIEPDEDKEGIAGQKDAQSQPQVEPPVQPEQKSSPNIVKTYVNRLEDNIREHQAYAPVLPHNPVLSIQSENPTKFPCTHVDHDEEKGVVAGEQKNWSEFGYDLDDAETPDRVVTVDPQPNTDEAATRVAALEVAQDLNQALASKGSSGDSTTTTEPPTIPSGGETPEKTAGGDPSKHQETFDAFLSDDEIDIVNIWGGPVQEQAEEKKPLQDFPRQDGNHVPSLGGDSSDYGFVEHGSTLCGVRTRKIIWFASFILCLALLVACLSLLVTKTRDGSEIIENRNPPLSETIDRDGLIPPTTPMASSTPPADMEGDESESPVPTDPTTEVTDPTVPDADPTDSTSTSSAPEPTISTEPAPFCNDNDEAIFFVNGLNRNCVWLREENDLDFQTSICGWHFPIRHNCRSTCETCDIFAPTAVPSAAPVPGSTAFPTMSPISPTQGPTGMPSITLISGAPTINCPPDLLGNIPGETITCLWLSRVNEHYRLIQCQEQLTREHCPTTCRHNCGSVE